MSASVETSSARPLPASVRDLVWFDLRRFRVLAALIVALEASRAAFAEWSLQLQPVASGGFGGDFGTPEMPMIDGILWLATVVTTVTIVQADLPSDDRAFWRTRPIAPLVLALGKLMTLALLFVVLPSGVNAIRLAAYGAPVSAVAAGTVQLAVVAGFVLVPTWALALIARTLPRFLAAAAALFVVGYVALGAVLYWVSLWRGRGGGPPFGPDWQGLASFGWLGALAVTAAWVAVLAAHYQHRRREITVVAALVLFGAAQLAPTRQPSIAAPPELAGLVVGRLGMLPIRLPSEAILAARRRSSTAFPVPLGVVLTLPPLPPDVSATVTTRHTRFVGRDTVPATGGRQCCFSAGPIAVVAPTPAAVRASPALGFGVDAAALDALRGTAVAVRADAEIRFQRHRLAGDIPLRTGSAIEVAGQRIEILDVEPLHPVVLVRYTAPPSLGSRNPLSVFVGDARRSRVVPAAAGWRGPGRPIDALVSRWHRFSGRNWAGRFHVLVHSAAAVGPDARLYVVESREAGAVDVPLAVDGLSLQPSKVE